MRGRAFQKFLCNACLFAGSFFVYAVNGSGQELAKLAAPEPSSPPTATDIHELSEFIQELQSQMQALNSQLSDLRAEQQRASEEASELRRELDLLRVPAAPVENGAVPPASESSAQPAVAQPHSPASPASPQEPTTSDRLARLEENLDVLEGKVNDQYQTKIESGSKYRVRLSGIALFNLYENRGTVENQDFPQLVQSPASEALFVSPGSFGGSLRQSQIRLQAFGPEIAGAKTSADVAFDFAGGFPTAPNGAVMGLVRLRTGTIRLDWENTSLVGGQDRLFFAPLAPTSVATLAVPALSYAGNLWAWTPQVRVEHRIALSDSSTLSIQGGILDSLTGDIPLEGYGRDPSWGEESGQPVYATRIAWSHRAFDQNLTLGAGGYYGRQNWGFNRTIDGWGGTLDATLPLGKRFELTGAFYRARGAGGFGGGIGQTALLNGSFIGPATTFRGLDSMGGWAQLKFKLRPNFEFNGAMGIDNPFASELRQFHANSIYRGTYTRNLSPMVNFIYQIRSDVLISTEYRWLNTSILDAGSNSASHINLSLGYLF
ncbi:MAG: hypothetical protein LAO08_17430 [Acidobacteriia bacterium]|nr:hypothetical protein [Terriglobia bacterium]